MAEAKRTQRRRPAGASSAGASSAGETEAPEQAAVDTATTDTGDGAAQELPADPGAEPAEASQGPGVTAPAAVVQAAPLDPPAEPVATDAAPEVAAVDAGQGIGVAMTVVTARDPLAELIGEDGSVLDPEQIFTDLGPHSTVVEVNQRVRERFTRDGARTPTERLFATPGQRVTRAEAARIRDVYALRE